MLISIIIASSFSSELWGFGVLGRLTKLGEAEGVILRGLANDTIAFSPPLIMTESEIDAMVERTGRALDALTVQLRRESIAVV